VTSWAEWLTGARISWRDWARQVAAEVGVTGLTDAQLDWLMWERTPFPMGDTATVRAALVHAVTSTGPPDRCPRCAGPMTPAEDADWGVCARCSARWED
jgi:hypothetical protein